MASLREVEARERAQRITVRNCRVELDLTGDTTTFVSRSVIRFTSDGLPTFIDVAPTALRAVRLNGSSLDVEALHAARFPLHPEAGENELVVEAVMGYRTDGEGLHRAVDPADGLHYTYAMSFLDAGPSIFACFDQPDLKAPYRLIVKAPGDWVVIGNAPGEQVEAGLWVFEETAPLSSYHVTLVAGPYHVLRDTTGADNAGAGGTGIRLGLSARRSLAADLDRDADELFTVTRQCFAEFHRLFGIAYPFGDYHQAFVPEFNAGAMENPGCVTFRDPLVFGPQVIRSRRTTRAITIAHEMAHQWFGNLVTPRWWDDLWLNESFAEYMGNRVTAEVTDFDDAWVLTSFARKQWGLIDDQRPSTHPVAGNGAEDAATALSNFDGISYTKGAALLKQLASRLGDEVFLAGVRDHFTRHRFGNATMGDLFAAWERAGAADLDGWTSSWLRTAGVDRITLDRSAAALVLEPPVGQPAPREHALEVAVHDGADWRRSLVRLVARRTPLPDGAAPNGASSAPWATAPVVLDPAEQTWALTAPDPLTVQALPQLLPAMNEPLMRAAVWNGLRSGVHLAAVDPSAVLAVLAAALPVEDSDSGVSRVCDWALTTLAPATADPQRAVAVVHRAAASRLDSAEVGSAVQLAAAEAFVTSHTDVDALRRWLAGSGLPEGVQLDLELRWRVLRRLATLGAVDRAELDQQYAAEPTARSEVELAGCLAALPDAAAKAWAWQRFIGQVEVPNYQLAAAGAGMFQLGQEALTNPYVERYFDEVPATAAIRSGWALAETAAVFFPGTAVEEAVVDRAEALASRPGLDPALRRVLLDRADDTRRLLAVRAAFPG